MAVHEILVMDDDLRRQALATDDPAALRAAARRAGMRTFLDCAIRKAARGLTSLEEARRGFGP